MANAYPLVEFSDIKFEEDIGRGTFGLVCKANWRGRVIAVKDFFANDGKEREDLEKELTQSFRITKHQHPNIIDLFGVSVNNGHTYLLMEYAYGGSLQQFLFGREKVEYTTERAISWMYQCAQGVAFLHAMKPKPLLHRDLKPANLLLTDSNCETLKICDFGTIRELKTTMTENKGSLAWTAPEVFNNRKYTEKCDVYSFAIILWEVFTREEYFRTFNSHWAIPEKVRKGDRPKLKDLIPDRIQTLMTSCWKKDPSKRPYMENVVVQMKSILETYGSNGGGHPIVEDEQKSIANFFATIVTKIGALTGFANGKGGAAGNEIISSSSTTQGVPFFIKIPRTPFTFFREGTEILVLEQLTSLNSIKMKAFEKGWFGITYKAQVVVDDETKMLALKVYYWNPSNIEKTLMFCNSFEKSLFRRENANAPYFMFVDEDKIYFGIDYVEGGSLYKFLHFESKRYSKRDALEWLTNLALGLQYFHNQYGRLYMLTSRNVFIDRFRNSKIKIGLPVMEQEADFFKTTYRSAAWMAPEVHEGGWYTDSSDIYSLGIIFWEIMNRKIPFEGFKPDEIAEMVKKGTRNPIKEDEDESIKKLLRSCWETDPESRPTLDSIFRTLRNSLSELIDLLYLVDKLQNISME